MRWHAANPHGRLRPGPCADSSAWRRVRWLADGDRAAIGELTDLLARRGPDDAGNWHADRAALGFRRLAVLDVMPAISPWPPHGRHVLVFNGEVYNFREIRKELEADGVGFGSDTDTEVVLHALARWGPGALARFHGMFALAFYDRAAHSVLLACDPLGIKPLYWLRHRKGLVFSSQYDAVVRHPWCERQRLRPDVAALYLRLGYVPSPYGIVEDTGQVRAGTYVLWSAEQGSVVRQYAPWPDRPDVYLSAADEEEAVHEAVQAAVRRQLVADVPVGTFLFGRHRFAPRHRPEQSGDRSANTRLHHRLGARGLRRERGGPPLRPPPRGRAHGSRHYGVRCSWVGRRCAGCLR